jgi:hypothetical protein
MKVLLENLKEKIEEGNADKALVAIDLVIEKLPEDGDLITEILSPVIITELHELLIEHLEVAPRAMQLNRRFSNSKTRAVMFAKAMRNGIVHVIK